jgi:uncharacterized protein
MIATNRIRSLLMLCCVLQAPSVSADAPRQLMWEDLTPKLQASENPFSKLTKEQLAKLTEVAQTRDRKARGDSTLSPADMATEQTTSRKLEDSGVDVDGLLAKRKEMAEQQRARGHTVNAALDGQVVRIPGYLLPLEFSGKRVSEFLLVPWVGACIHTPPPPPNQIVHVQADKPFEFGGLFAPVWVTGRMSTASAKKSLYLIDGSADIDIGYSLHASQVEPYKE